MVAALGNNRVLGQNNELLWHIPDDLKRFKTLTLGHPVIMGRKTFESIVAVIGKPLPGRTNVVISRDPDYKGPSFVEKTVDKSGWAPVLVYTSLDEAIAAASEIDTDQIFVIGGGQIYKAALPRTDTLYLTLINDTKDGDVYFPAYETEFTNKTFEEQRAWNGLAYTWVDLKR